MHTVFVLLSSVQFEVQQNWVHFKCTAVFDENYVWMNYSMLLSLSSWMKNYVNEILCYTFCIIFVSSFIYFVCFQLQSLSFLISDMCDILIFWFCIMFVSPFFLFTFKCTTCYILYRFFVLKIPTNLYGIGFVSINLCAASY